jgi:hypothetical protein
MKRERLKDRYKHLIKPYLKIVPIDLSENQEFKSSPYFDEELLRPDVRRELLKNLCVRAPFLLDQPMKGMGLGAKYVVSKIECFGDGCMLLIVDAGFEILNPSNEQHTKQKNAVKPIKIMIMYDSVKQEYEHVLDQNKHLFEKKKKEMNYLKYSDEMQGVLISFDVFFKEYWDKKKYELPGKVEQYTYKQVREHLTSVRDEIEATIVDFIDIYYLFGYVDGFVHEFHDWHAHRLINAYDRAIEVIEKNQSSTMDEPYSAHGASIEADGVLKCAYSYCGTIFEEVLTPGYLVIRGKREPYPNIGELYYVEQPKHKHENESTRLKMQLDFSKVLHSMSSYKEYDRVLFYRDQRRNGKPDSKDAVKFRKV